MQEITLENTPQQQFSISLGGFQWDLTFRTENNATVNCTLATLVRDGVKVIDSVLCAPNMPIFPFSYFSGGDFLFVCDKGEYPNYENFGKTVKLYWLDTKDIAQLLGAN